MTPMIQTKDYNQVKYNAQPCLDFNSLLKGRLTKDDSVYDRSKPMFITENVNLSRR